MPTALELAESYRKALDAHDARALRRIMDTYGTLYRRLQGDIDALGLATEGKQLTAGQVARLSQYRRLMEDARRELERYQGWLETEIEGAARASIRLGLSHWEEYIRTNIGVAAGFQRLAPDVIETLLGFLDPSGPLYARLRLLAPTVTDNLARMIVDGIARGVGPRETARLILRGFGVGLADSLRMMRTVQLYSYREANRAQFIAHKEVVKGWVWWARLEKNGAPDEKVCASCLAMHGTVHELSEPMSDHHNGRCLMLPLTIGKKPGDLVSESGAAWFARQSEAYQRKILGPGKFEAWKAGKFPFSALSVERQDDVYGAMRVETPLKDLVTDE